MVEGEGDRGQIMNEEETRQSINRVKSLILDHVSRACSVIEDHRIEFELSESVITYTATIPWDIPPLSREVTIIIREARS